jgi:hypothetical protein
MAIKELTALTPEMNCDQTVMGLSPAIFAVFFIIISLLMSTAEAHAFLMDYT